MSYPLVLTSYIPDRFPPHRSLTESAEVEPHDSAESFELPGADLSEEVLSVRVIPKQADEFTCTSCFLVHHRSRLASEAGGQLICMDCAA